MQKSIIDHLIRFGQQAPSADNTQPWRFRWDGTGLSLSFDEDRGKSSLFGSEGHGTLLCMGAVVENWQQACQAAGIQCKWRPDDRPGHYGKLAINGDIANTEIPEEHPVLLRHTNRGAFRYDPIPGDIESDLTSLREDTAQVRLFSQNLSVRRIADLVDLASQMRFQNQLVHEWLGRSLRFTETEVAGGDGLDIKTLALPPGGNALLSLIKDWKRMALLNRFGAYRLLAAIESQNIKKAPAIVAVTGRGERDAILAAGRLMERAWVLLNSRGIAVHPYYVVSDQLIRRKNQELPEHLENLGSKLYTEAIEIFGRETTVHMLLRIGIPKTNAPRSLRLPISAIFSDTQVDV